MKLYRHCHPQLLDDNCKGTFYKIAFLTNIAHIPILMLSMHAKQTIYVTFTTMVLSTSALKDLSQTIYLKHINISIKFKCNSYTSYRSYTLICNIKPGYYAQLTFKHNPHNFPFLCSAIFCSPRSGNGLYVDHNWLRDQSQINFLSDTELHSVSDGAKLPLLHFTNTLLLLLHGLLVILMSFGS